MKTLRRMKMNLLPSLWFLTFSLFKVSPGSKGVLGLRFDFHCCYLIGPGDLVVRATGRRSVKGDKMSGVLWIQCEGQTS